VQSPAGRPVSQSEDLSRQAKYLGGVGKKITGTSRRKFKPNLQKVRMVVDGVTKRVWFPPPPSAAGWFRNRSKRQPFSMQSV